MQTQTQTVHEHKQNVSHTISLLDTTRYVVKIENNLQSCGKKGFSTTVLKRIQVPDLHKHKYKYASKHKIDTTSSFVAHLVKYL